MFRHHHAQESSGQTQPQQFFAAQPIKLDHGVLAIGLYQQGDAQAHQSHQQQLPQDEFVPPDDAALYKKSTQRSHTKGETQQRKQIGFADGFLGIAMRQRQQRHQYQHIQGQTQLQPKHRLNIAIVH